MWGAKVNLINWIRQPALMWSFSTKKVGLARDLFYAPTREHAQATIIHHMRMMFGDELEELRWEWNEEYNADVLMEYLDGKLEGDFGYLKLVNDKIKTIDEVMDNYVELSEEEKQRKEKRISAYDKLMKGSKPDPEDYYGYNPSNRNPYGESQFEE